MQYSVCNKTLIAGSLQAHVCRLHGRDATGAMVVTPPTEAPCCIYKLNFAFQSENSQKIVDFPIWDCLY